MQRREIVGFGRINYIGHFEIERVPHPLVWRAGHLGTIPLCARIVKIDPDWPMQKRGHG